jgi:hypothetical protein
MFHRFAIVCRPVDQESRARPPTSPQMTKISDSRYKPFGNDRITGLSQYSHGSLASQRVTSYGNIIWLCAAITAASGAVLLIPGVTDLDKRKVQESQLSVSAPTPAS